MKSFFSFQYLVVAVFFILSLGIVYANDNVTVSEDVQFYLQEMLERQGEATEGISNVVSVDKTKLPSSIDVEKIDENQVEIYQVDYPEGGVEKSVYVVSFSAASFEGVEVESLSKGYNYLLFNSNSAGFIGDYVMMDSGSVSGISSSLKYSGDGDVDVEVFLNGKSIGLMNEISSQGDSYDFDLQSDNFDLFVTGDRINVKVTAYGGVNVEEVSSVVKIKI